MCSYIEYECEDCGHQEERDLKRVLGASPDEDDYEVESGELESCPKCGSTDLMVYTTGGRDEGREDFHSDG